MVDDIVPVTRELLARKRRCRNNNNFTWKLPAQPFEQSFYCLNFSNRNRVNPDRPVQLRQFQEPQPVSDRREIFTETEGDSQEGSRREPRKGSTYI